MKKFLLSVLLILPSVVTAKELPPPNEAVERLDLSGITLSDKWESVGDSLKQNVKNGVIIVSASSVSSMIEISSDDDKVMDSFAYANMHCAGSSLIAIDMAQNKTLLNNMLESFTAAIKAYDNETNTMVWGYNFKTKLLKTDLGLIATCTLQ